MYIANYSTVSLIFLIFLLFLLLFWKYKEFLDNKLTNLRVGDFQRNSNKGYSNMNIINLV